MKGATHAAAGAAIAIPLALMVGHGIWEPAMLGVGAVAALLADVDHPHSKAGRYVPWPVHTRTSRSGFQEVGRALPFGRTLWHRGETHSLAAGVLVTLITGAVLLLTHAHLPAGVLAPLLLSILAGYWSHLALDAVNTTPMPLLWPISRKRFRSPLPPLSQHSLAGKGAEVLTAIVAYAALGNWLLLPAVSAMHFVLPHNPLP